jgi:glycogen debranching enzyme
MQRSHHRHKGKVLTRTGPAKIRETHRALVLKRGDLVLSTDDGGDIPFELPHGYGLFFHDCRFLDGYELRINGERQTALSATTGQGYETTHYLTNPPLRRRDGTGGDVPSNRLAVRRIRLARDDVVYEWLRLSNYARRPLRLRIELRFRARFEDLFTVKGFLAGPRGSVSRPRARGHDVITLSYRGRDHTVRSTEMSFRPRPTRLTTRRATFDLILDPRTSAAVTITVTPRIDSADRARRGPRSGPAHHRLAGAVGRTENAWLDDWTSIESSSALFDRVLGRGLRDLGILRSRLHGFDFFAAGVPWYVTLFGRDSATVALQTLAYHPGMARETLRLLARYQARKTDQYRDAEPGKILHEFRDGELAHLAAIPQSPAYYGTVDATMLFLILIAEYVTWSGDVDFARALRPNIDLALRWMEGPADGDGDGYIDYQGRYRNGLLNQGWKDSGDAVVDADGSIAEPPIALCEVQGYAYRAWRQTSTLLRRLGDAGRADDLRRRAAALYERFARDYWDDRLGGYIFARQRGGRPCAVMTSNAGQVLWGGLARPEHARRVAHRLLDEDMFSGWGIRTLSSGARAYNPMSYHLGSVWPHDNALILCGFLRYGLAAEALRIFDAVFDAATRFRDYRLPELYCGYAKRDSPEQPIRYPVACSPQAWAAGALPYALANLLGLRPEATTTRLHIVEPELPRLLEWLQLKNLRIGRSRLDIRWERAARGRLDVTWRVRDARLDVERVDRRSMRLRLRAAA